MASMAAAKKAAPEALKIFSALFGCHQEFLLDDLRQRRAFCFKG
jgi:hypothetical protein